MLNLAKRALALAFLLFSFSGAPARAENEKNWQALSEAAYAAAQSAPSDAVLWNKYGFYAYRAGATTEAIEALHKSLALKPDFPVAWNNLGAVYLQARNYDRAIQAFEKALAYDETYSKAKYNLAVAKFRKGDYKDAFFMYWDLRETDEAYVDKRTDLTKAERELDSAINENPDNGFLKSVKKGYEKHKEGADRDPWGW